MERPKADVQPRQRQVTGEVAYLDAMRRLKLAPKAFDELGDMAIQMYEAEADLLDSNRVRPAILDEYERYDGAPSEVVASCVALTNELLTLKDPESRLTFVDVVVDARPEDVLKKIQNMSAGKLLSGADEQLALPSNGEYYPVLDIRKQNARLVGVGLRAWGWDDTKYVFTNENKKDYEYPRDLLMYPSDEKSSTRRLEVSFAYSDGKSEGFTESVSLNLSARGIATMSSTIWAAAYAETGYEGHKHSSFQDLSDDDVATFGDLIAEIVGDEPESIAMKTNRQLNELAESAATPSGRQAVENLVEVTWPAQAQYFLMRKRKGAEKTIAEQLRDEVTAEVAVEAIDMIIEEWKEKRSK